VKKDCPSQRAYLAIEDGGYISASDVEEDDKEDGTDDVEDVSFMEEKLRRAI
jgi:hypothetical protein